MLGNLLPPPAWCHVSTAGGRQQIPSSASSGSKAGLCGWRERSEESLSGWRMWWHKLHRKQKRQLNLFRNDWEASNYNGFQNLTPTWHHKKEVIWGLQEKYERSLRLWQWMTSNGEWCCWCFSIKIIVSSWKKGDSDYISCIKQDVGFFSPLSQSWL